MIDTQLMITGPAYTLKEAGERFQELARFVRDLLKKDLDYGVIPGTNKPALLKPGAEKLCTFFGLVPHFEEMSLVEDWTGKDHNNEPFFYYKYRCVLYKGNYEVAEQIASINSWEEKFRWRTSSRTCPECDKETIFKDKKSPFGFYCWQKRGGCGYTFKPDDERITNQETGRSPNDRIFDQVNTLQKQGQKRALVGATLIGVNASEFFTQDIEELVQGNWEEVKEEKVDPVVMQRVVSEQASRVASATSNVEVTQVEYPESQIGPEFDAPTPNLEPIGEPFTEGVLTYRLLNGVKMVKWGDAWKPAESPNKTSQLQKDNLAKKYKNEFEMENSLFKHHGVKTLASLTWEQFAATASFKFSGKADPRWYADKIEPVETQESFLELDKMVEAKKSGPPAAPKNKKAVEQYPEKFILKAYDIHPEDDDFPGLKDFISNMQASGEPLILQKLMQAGLTPSSDWGLYMNLSQGLADKTFIPGPAFNITLQEVIDAAKQPAGN